MINPNALIWFYTGGTMNIFGYAKVWRNAEYHRRRLSPYPLYFTSTQNFVRALPALQEAEVNLASVWGPDRFEIYGGIIAGNHILRPFFDGNPESWRPWAINALDDRCTTPECFTAEQLFRTSLLFDHCWVDTRDGGPILACETTNVLDQSTLNTFHSIYELASFSHIL